MAAGVQVNSYVAIRADESNRGGMKSTHRTLRIHLPFVEAGIDKLGVSEILEASGLGLPAYYSWRSRSGCTFCFYQRKIEWVRLKEEHPEAFEEARSYEKIALEHESPFTWSQGESLDQLSQPSRIAEIEEDHDRRLARARQRTVRNPLHAGNQAPDLDDLYGVDKICLACHK